MEAKKKRKKGKYKFKKNEYLIEKINSKNFKKIFKIKKRMSEN